MTSPHDTLADFEDTAIPFLSDVMRFALSLTHDVSNAEDLVQDTFLNARRSWHQFIAGSDCKAWLFAICRNRFYRVREQAERQIATEDGDLESLAALRELSQADEAALGARLERNELRNAIRVAMYGLPIAFRDVAMLVDWHDQSYDKAAEILGIPIGTVRSRLFRARRLLQEQLMSHARDAGLSTVKQRSVATEAQS